MSQLFHRVKVFVFRFDHGRPDYLLLRGSQGIESFWGPVHGPIGFGEKIEAAARREVMHDTGLVRPSELIDLQLPSRWVLGDEEVVEWSYAFRTPSEPDSIELDRRWAEFQWAEFGLAFPRLELEHDRAVITRLHTLLSAA